MADEAFALSPISARPTTQTDADYDAIREAFMETSRGRWFLTEYTRRNRNADTALVLDAVARIEASLAAGAQQQEADHTALVEALAALRTAVHTARRAVMTTLLDPPLEETLAPARTAVRVLREVSWTLRECGSEARICDKLDVQAVAIAAVCDRLAEPDRRESILGCFDQLVREIDALDPAGPNEAATAARDFTPPVPEPVVQPAIPAEAATAADIPAEPQRAATAKKTAAAAPEAAVAPEPETTSLVASEPKADLTARELRVPEETAAAETAVPAAPPAPTILDTVLDAIAAEISDDARALPEEQVKVQPASPLTRQAANDERAMPPVFEPSARAAGEHDAVSEQNGSLGAALIQRGLVASPASKRPDPLAPFRRMTQAERIAFFS